MEQETKTKIKYRNQLYIIGTLPRDAVESITKSGISMLKFTVGVALGKPKENGYPESTYFDVTAFREMADNQKYGYLQKGDLVEVEGPVSINSYTGRDGVQRSNMQVIANRIQKLANGKQNVPPEVYKHEVKQPKPDLGLNQVEFTEDDIPF